MLPRRVCDLRSPNPFPTHVTPSTCILLTWRRLLDVDASFVLAYDFTFRRFPMQLHIRPRSTALHDERFVCVAHHAMLRRTQCQAVMVIGQDASCNDRKREKDELGGAITLVNGSLIATAAAQLATRLKCKLKTCFPSLGQDDSLPACQFFAPHPVFFPSFPFA